MLQTIWYHIMQKSQVVMANSRMKLGQSSLRVEPARQIKLFAVAIIFYKIPIFLFVTFCYTYLEKGRTPKHMCGRFVQERRAVLAEDEKD